MTERVVLKINGKTFQFWENINLNLSLDSIDTFDFTTPMNAEDIEFRETFAPAKYLPVEILLNDETILTGTLNNKNTSLSSKTLSLGGYSKPGVLKDLSVPPDKYPLEFKNQTLAQIAGEIAGYYDVQVLFFKSPGAAFTEGVSLEPAEKILEFLIKLAHKRNLLVGNDAGGNLLFFEPTASSGSTPLRQGELPLMECSVEFNEQEMFDSVTGYGAAIAGRDPEAFTVPITVLSGINRPFVYTVSEAKGAELQEAVKFKAGRIFANSMRISVSSVGWQNAGNKKWAPGQFVSLYSPNNFFYNETKLMIRNIRLTKSGSDETANLDLIFPGVYSGQLPKKLPWE